MVQIAGVIDQAEADLIIEAGADMLGFPLGLKDGREDLGIEEAARIVAEVSERVACVCITYLETASDIGALCRRTGAGWVQLHGAIDIPELRKLKSHCPDLGIIKSLIVGVGSEAGLLKQVAVFEALVDAFITDTYDPATGRSGATGRTHDWEVSRAIVAATRVPVILAGGLTADNVAEAIAAVGPAAVDAHTGVEDPDGRKDRALLSKFVQEAARMLRP